MSANTAEVHIDEVIDSQGRPRIRIKSEKFKNEFVIKKAENGFALFDIVSDKGNIPEELKGSYTKLSVAKKHVLDYIRRAKVSRTIQRDKTYEKNHTKAD